MFFLLGLVIVVVSVVSGYTMHEGNLWLLWQPNELVIIIGAGIGAAIITNPIHVLKDSLKSLSFLFRGSPHTKKDYLELMVLFFNMTRLIRSKGMVEAESHIEDPKNSEIFNSARSLLNEKRNLSFVCDNFRLLSMGVENTHQFENMLDHEIEVREFNVQGPSKAFLTLGDSLPALGIVAAVMGVILTMKSILEPPEILGSLIAAALVGTFTGVLLAYGLFNPIGYFLSKYADYQVKYLECIKVGFVSYLNGHSPTVVVEFMRKTVPDSVKPTFSEMDAIIANNTLKF